MKNKSRFLLYPLVIMGVLLILAISCKKDENNDNPISTTVTDIDGNVYHTVTIGTQVWLVENLKVTKYRNGDPIPNITDNTSWYNLTTGAYCNFANDTSYTNTYGVLYNWYAVNDNRKIAPTGWHVPTDAEWKTLATYLGGENVAGGKLKETGTTHWNSPNTEATNETGFTALPGGCRYYHGSWGYVGDYGFWWSTTERDASSIWRWSMYYHGGILRRDIDTKDLGFSVRCVRD